jgi:hypothetical protein
MLERVEIESLLVRAPGITRADATALAGEIADEIHRLLPALDGDGHRHVAELTVRVPSDAPRSRWPRLIARGLIQQLAEARHA